MKGSPKIIELLNNALTKELTAVNQYFIRSKMCENWGYLALAKQYYDESIGEMKHAEELIKRILFLEGRSAQRSGADESVVQSPSISIPAGRSIVKRSGTTHLLS